MAFGAFVAAGLPVLLAFSAVMASGGLAAVASHLVHASDATSSVMLLMGMAVGVDYSLFYLKREREERRRGHARRAGAGRGHLGRAVLASGITVLIAMAGMLLTGSKVFDSIGIGAMLVVFMAMVGSLTVLPALLGRLGDKVDKGRIRRAAPRVAGVGRRAASRCCASRCRRRSPPSRVLVVLALPALGLHTTLLGRERPAAQHSGGAHLREDPEGVPRGPDAGRGGRPQPATSPRLRRRRRSPSSSGWRWPAARPSSRSRPPSTADHTAVQIQVPLVGSGSDKASMAALATLRDKVLPASIGQLPGAQFAVTGETAGTHDFNAQIKHSFPLVFAFVLGLAFLLLLMTFRSLVIPLTSIVLNLLSVGAAYGVLVWIFQEGHLQGLLGFHSNGAVVTWLPLFLFAVLFGLSMDYHVFIVSRIKELRDGGLPTAEAVARGIGSTASTVTAAAAVMVAVFAIFAWLPTLDIKQLGVGLAIAVLLDATLIRGVLLPATMKMLGEWNWYLPRWLQWLPRVNLEAARPTPAGSAEGRPRSPASAARRAPRRSCLTWSR